MANEFRDIGRDIRNAVLDAVNSGDFSSLNSRIGRSVGQAIDEVNSRLNARYGNTWQTPPGHDAGSTIGAQNAAWQRVEPIRMEPQLYARHPKGSGAGLACTITGAAMLGGFAIAMLAVFLIFLFAEISAFEFWITFPFLSVFALGSAVLLGIGRKLMRRTARFRRYIKTIGTKKYCEIADLARDSRKKERFVVQDLQDMIRRGMFLQAHIDDEQKTLILTDEMYAEYRELKRRRAELAAEEARRANESDAERQFRETLEQGETYLREIREANDAIPGEVVSQKLYRLEEIVRRIFEQVRSVPSQIPELRRFMEYYMPTTLKLVQTYRELDAQPIAGENIRTAKTEIEKTLDTINLAFENLFDSLFASTTVDITSDISVLKTLLHQEGLTEKDFA